MIFQSPEQIVTDDIFLELPNFAAGVRVLLKLEGFNPAGSIKLKTAVELIESLERQGRIAPGMRVIESSSGNLGVALSVVCAAKGYDLTIVTDPNTTAGALRRIQALGARVVVITKRDANAGFLASRIEYIRQALARDPWLVWPNQYANPANPAAHHRRTAAAIHREFPQLDVLMIGAGTTGTLMGCLSYFRQNSPRTRIVAVDAEGSVLFGGPSRQRHLPGLGASRVPELFVDGGFDKVVVAEADSVRMCRALAQRRGLLVGGSTGTVLAAVKQIEASLAPGSTLVAISPDMGENYVDSIYADGWVNERWPSLSTEEERISV